MGTSHSRALEADASRSWLHTEATRRARWPGALVPHRIASKTLRNGEGGTSTEIADETDETIQELLICEFKMRKIFAAADLSTAQTTEYEALQTRQKILTDEIWWQSIFHCHS